MQIKKIQGFEMLDSRGNPTVRAEVLLSDGTVGIASVPSGASTGQYEALELRDGDNSRYNGKGVKKAINNINSIISPALCALGTAEQDRVDRELINLDGTESKGNLGANAILAVSLATARAVSQAYHIPLYRYLGGICARTLPIPLMNILNGGAHAANNIDIQEFMIMPVEAQNFSEALRMGSEIYHSLGGILKERGLSSGVGDEGGFAPNLNSNEEAIELIIQAIEVAGYNTQNVKIALDAATSEWYTGSGYTMPKIQRNFSTEELIEFWENLCGKYPIASIEDALGENDWNGWRMLTEKLSGKIQLVGDDLFVTNPLRLNRGICENAGNAILVKYNQIGTLTEAITAVQIAKNAGFGTIISHRSGETEDTTIADFAVAVNSGQIKTGAPCRTDRTAKYNRLLRIEAELKGLGVYGHISV